MLTKAWQFQLPDHLAPGYFTVDFRAKSFTSFPVSKETEAMVTICDLDELSHCSLKTASGGQQAQAVGVFLQPEH